MKNYIYACLITILIFLSGVAFSQANKDEYKSDTTSVNPPSDNSYVKGITDMRAKSLIGVVLGLTSLIIGWRAKIRSSNEITNKTKNGAIFALILGGVAFVLSVVHLSNTLGGVFGSGSGKAGAIVGLILSLIGIIFSSLALRNLRNINRFRR